MDNKLDQILEAIGLSREDLTPDEIKQLEEAIANNDEDTIMDILTPKLEAGKEEAPNDIEDTSNEGNTPMSTEDTEDTSMSTEDTEDIPMSTEDTEGNSMNIGNSESEEETPMSTEEESSTDPMENTEEEPYSEETPDLTKDESQSPEITDDFVKQNYDNFKNGNTPAYSATSSNNIDKINPSNPETIESLSIDEMLNILSGKEDENLKDNTDQMNGEDPNTYVDEVKEAVSQEIKKKINGEGEEEESSQEETPTNTQGMM